MDTQTIGTVKGPALFPVLWGTTAGYAKVCEEIRQGFIGQLKDLEGYVGGNGISTVYFAQGKINLNNSYTAMIQAVIAVNH